ncbi:MAG: hypothetical protein ACJ749_17520 [Flavisolibacter sp.]
MKFHVSSLPTWLIFVLTFIIGILVAEAGSRLTPEKKPKGTGEKEESAISLVGAMLGLLAFILGFTFSITSSRFSERKTIIVRQAQLISTCYLRAGYLPEVQKTETRKLLANYTTLLLETPAAVDADMNVAKMEAIQMKVWQLAVSLTGENMDAELRSLYVGSVNDVLEIFSKRKTIVLVFRVPSAIWVSLLLLYVLSMFVVGLEIKSRKSRRKINILVMAAAFAMIVSLIVEMDLATKGSRFAISQKPLMDVQKMIKEDSMQAVK